MDHYIGTKTLKARPMTRGEYNDYREWDIPKDEDPNEAGYLVEYEDGGKQNDPRHDGYISWSPADVFEKAYRPIYGLSFSQALEALKSGQRVARHGWNGKGMFVYMVPANSYTAQTPVAKAFFGEDAMVPYNAYMALKGVDGRVSTWVPSSSDCFADDWEIVD